GRDIGLGHTPPGRAGVLGQLERDSRALARPMAQVALPRERLQKRPPPRAQRLSEMPQTTPRADRRDELLAGEWPVRERVASSASESLDLLRRHAEVPLPARTLPRAPGRDQREVDASVLGVEEMERAAHRPRLDQRTGTQGTFDLAGS